MSITVVLQTHKPTQQQACAVEKRDECCGEHLSSHMNATIAHSTHSVDLVQCDRRDNRVNGSNDHVRQACKTPCVDASWQWQCNHRHHRVAWFMQASDMEYPGVVLLVITSHFLPLLHPHVFVSTNNHHRSVCMCSSGHDGGGNGSGDGIGFTECFT